MSTITVDALAREYGLPRSVALEIRAIGREQAMRRHWQCWTLLVAVPLAILSFAFVAQRSGSDGRIVGLYATMLCIWTAAWLADRYAEPETRRMAEERSRRFAGASPEARPPCPWPELKAD